MTLNKRFESILDRLPSAEAERERRQAEQEQDRRRRVRERLAAWARQRGRRYAGCRLANYRCVHPGQAEVLQRVRDWVAAWPHVGSMVLFGPSGTGKDHLAAGAAVELIERNCLRVAYTNGLDLFAANRDRMADRGREDDLLRPLVAADLLVLSDPLPPLYAGDHGRLTDCQSAILYRLIEARYQAERPLAVTLNVADGDEADARLGVPITDRLRHGATACWCDWPSYRSPAAHEIRIKR